MSRLGAPSVFGHGFLESPKGVWQRYCRGHGFCLVLVGMTMTWGDRIWHREGVR